MTQNCAPRLERLVDAVADGPIGFMTGLKTAEGPRTWTSRAIVSYLPKGFTSLPARPFSLKFLADGEECYRGEAHARSVRSGQILIAPSGQDLDVELRRPSAGLCLYFDLPEASAQTLPTMRLNACEFELGRAVAELAEETLRSHGQAEQLVQRFLTESRGLVEDLIEDLETASRRVGGVRSETRRQRLETMTAGRMYLERHADRPILLEQAAAAAGMSVFHFARQFTQVFGETPAAFHERHRLQLASDWLRSGLSATQVAKGLGYSDLSVFSRAFSRRFGVSPSRAAHTKPLPKSPRRPQAPMSSSLAS